MLADLVEGHTVAALRTGPYAPPGTDLVAALPSFLERLAVGTPTAALGLQVQRVEGRTVLHPPVPGGEPYVLLAVPSGVPGLLVEVPHPYADLHTELIALGVLERVPGAMLLQAGAHRVAAGPLPGMSPYDRAAYPADVAVQAESLFSRIADGLVARCALAQVQLHGFADLRSRRGVDVVVSSGAAATGALVADLRAALAATGLRVRTPEDPRCADLAGRRNVQGLAARRHGTVFAHLEVSRAVRDDAARRGAVADAVAACVPAR